MQRVQGTQFRGSGYCLLPGLGTGGRCSGAECSAFAVIEPSSLQRAIDVGRERSAAEMLRQSTGEHDDDTTRHDQHR